MTRLVAAAAAIAAIILFVIIAAGNPADPLTDQEWGFACLAISLLALALEPFVPGRSK